MDDEIHNVYFKGDSFDADALIYGETAGKFVVDEDLICYEIKKEDFLDLIQDKSVQNYFLQDFVTRHQHLKEHAAQSELTPFLISRVADIYLHPASIVKEQTSIFDAIVAMKENKASAVIVEFGTGVEETFGIVTDTNLKDKVLLGGVSVQENIGKIATKGVITIDKSDFLFNALLLMTHNEIKRVVVTENGVIIGVLEQMDLLSYFANHSYLVAVQIDKARTIEDLKSIQNDLRNLITILNSKGVKVRYITKLVSTLNLKVYKKVFHMFVEESLQNKCALIVMGSEGREEQSIKTDQDNALIIADDIDAQLFEKPMIDLNAALLELGFPKCRGDVMVSNAFWRKQVKEYKDNIDTWCGSMDDESLQKLSIFLDAKCVSGECSLLETLQDYLFEGFSTRDDVLAHMARSTLYFDTPISIFSGFLLDKEHENKLNLKKGGVFALVHGIRCLSLQYKIRTTNTIERIKELNNIGVFDKVFATELIESFDTLSNIRLKAMLQSTLVTQSNYINPNTLDKASRDLLKDSFKVVNKFKKFITFHFHLNMVG